MHILLVVFYFIKIILQNSAAIAQQPIAYDQLLNASIVNCTATLPKSAVSYMAAYSAANPNVSQLVQVYTHS